MSPAAEEGGKIAVFGIICASNTVSGNKVSALRAIVPHPALSGLMLLLARHGNFFAARGQPRCILRAGWARSSRACIDLYTRILYVRMPILVVTNFIFWY